MRLLSSVLTEEQALDGILRSAQRELMQSYPFYGTHSSHRLLSGSKGDKDSGSRVTYGNKRGC